MTVSTDRFRDVLGCLAGGVCVITTRDPDGRARGLTATAVCSVSLEPPLVLVCVGSTSHTHDAIEASGIFAVSFLGAGDASIADRFAGEDENKFRGLTPREAITGSPVLESGLGYCDCVVVERLRAGDHTVFIGRVEAAGVSASADDSGLPLLHYRGSYLPGGAYDRRPEEAAGEGTDAG